VTLRPHEHAALLRLVHKDFVKTKTYTPRGGQPASLPREDFCHSLFGAKPPKFSGKVVLPPPSGGYYYWTELMRKIFLQKFYNCCGEFVLHRTSRPPVDSGRRSV
jgi:hypothetical protein